jgi:hypothetical protein
VENSASNDLFTLIADDDIVIREFTIRRLTGFFEVDVQDICPASYDIHRDPCAVCWRAGSKRRYSAIARAAIVVAFDVRCVPSV